jgi:DNA-binding CsgD family transcriptional regulator
MKALLCVNVAYCRLSSGDLAGARDVLRDELDERSAATAVKVWAQALRIRLRTLLGDDGDASEPFSATMAAALQLGEPQVVALAGGAISKELLAAGDGQSARETIDGALYAVSAFDYTHWLLDAVAQAGDALSVVYARSLLDEAQRHDNPLANAWRSLFDARCALRPGAPGDGRDLAARAAREFVALGLPVDAAEALEAAGDVAGALAIYRRTGASVAVGRLEGRAGGRRRQAVTGASPLTRREREIAELLARGYSSRVVATELGIGQRTVETHVAAIYEKLGIKSRAELARRISDEQSGTT